jgi:signal peptidase II
MAWGRVARSVSAVALGIVALDQATKAIMVAWIGPDAGSHRFEVAGRLLAFEYVENTGAAFGMLAGRIWLVSVLAIVVAVGFLLGFRRELPGNALLRTSVAAVLGGAIGNLVDRLRLGYVVDFIAVGTFPRFNVADSAVTIGIVLLMAVVVLDETRQERPT